jgi:hypothetical protein
VTQPDNEPIRGMVFKLKHVLHVEDLVEAAPAAKKGKK